MSEKKYTETDGSFLYGKKKFAKYNGNYLDPDNIISKGSTKRPDLTSGTFYQITSEGRFHNPQNHFRTDFDMIFIKDNRDEIYGVDEECFDLSESHVSAYEINLRSQPPGLDPVPKYAGEQKVEEPELEEEDDEPVAQRDSGGEYQDLLQRLEKTFDHKELVGIRTIACLKRHLSRFNDCILVVNNLKTQQYKTYYLENGILFNGSIKVIEGNVEQATHLICPSKKSWLFFDK